jgi:spoIIIJ-associated protein
MSKKKFFSGNSLRQALISAAAHFDVPADEIAYREVEKKHGFLKVRKRVVIEVDVEDPRRPPAASPAAGGDEPAGERLDRGATADSGEAALAADPARRRPPRLPREDDSHWGGAGDRTKAARGNRAGEGDDEASAATPIAATEVEEADEEKPARGRGRGRRSPVAGEGDEPAATPASGARTPRSRAAATEEAEAAPAPARGRRPRARAAEAEEAAPTAAPARRSRSRAEEADEEPTAPAAAPARRPPARAEEDEEVATPSRRRPARDTRPPEPVVEADEDDEDDLDDDADDWRGPEDEEEVPAVEARPAAPAASGEEARGDGRRRRRRRGGRGRSGGASPAAEAGDGEDELVALPERPRRPSERFAEARGPLADAARDALDRVLDVAGLDLSYTVLQGDDRLEIDLTGPDEALLVAEGGELLRAIEHLVPRAVRSLAGESINVRVDAADFHEIHEEQLRTLAQRVASEVRRGERPRTLEPMSPADRRIVHITLADEPGVTSMSEGTGYFKRIVVKPD